MVEQGKAFTIIFNIPNMSIFDTSQLSPELEELLLSKLSKELNYCKTCGSKLGVDCGDAEPDYNKDYCSVGCYESKDLTYENPTS